MNGTEVNGTMIMYRQMLDESRASIRPDLRKVFLKRQGIEYGKIRITDYLPLAPDGEQMVMLQAFFKDTSEMWVAYPELERMGTELMQIVKRAYRQEKSLDNWEVFIKSLDLK